MNADKCRLICSNHNVEVNINIDDNIIKGETSVKLLGIKIDNKLKFEEHVKVFVKKQVKNFMLLQE